MRPDLTKVRSNQQQQEGVTEQPSRSESSRLQPPGGHERSTQSQPANDLHGKEVYTGKRENEAQQKEIKYSDQTSQSIPDGTASSYVGLSSRQAVKKKAVYGTKNTRTGLIGGPTQTDIFVFRVSKGHRDSILRLKMFK